MNNNPRRGNSLVGFLFIAFAACLVAGCAEPGAAGSGAASGPATTNLPPMSDVDVPIKDPDSTDTVSWAMAIDPGSVKAGEFITVAVRAKTAPTWHIYAVDKPTGVNIATTFKLQLPEGLQEVGEWDIPESHAIDDETYAYDTDVVFRKQVAVAANAAAGLKNIACQVGFQVCNDSMCKPPATKQVTAALEVSN